MNIETLASTIQVIIAPVVMITACSVLLGSLSGHYAAINDRMRDMTLERLDLLRTGGAAPDDAIRAERLGEIDVELPDLLHRHKHMRDAVVLVYSAILVFIASMLVIAGAEITQASWLAALALIVFLAGTALLLVGVLRTVLEVRVSHETVEYEVQRVLSLRRE